MEIHTINEKLFVKTFWEIDFVSWKIQPNFVSICISVYVVLTELIWKGFTLLVERFMYDKESFEKHI